MGSPCASGLGVLQASAVNVPPIAHKGSEQDNGRYRQDQQLHDDQNLQNGQYVMHGVILAPVRHPFNPG
jgi:hypothetical protein